MEGPQQTESNKSQEAVKKDVNKMNIKELKACWALRWVFGKKNSARSWAASKSSRPQTDFRVFFLSFTVMVWAGSG